MNTRQTERLLDRYRDIIRVANELPSDLEIGDVTRIGLMAFGLSALATLYPSWRGSRVRPAEALRYE